MTDLLPCPFCGGKAYINNAKTQGCQLHGEKHTIFRVQCKHKDAKWKDDSALPECHVKPSLTAWTREEAAKRWNGRAAYSADPRALDAALELLEQKNKAIKELVSCLQACVDQLEADTYLLYEDMPHTEPFCMALARGLIVKNGGVEAQTGGADGQHTTSETDRARDNE